MRQYSGIWTLSQVAQAISDENWPGQPPPNVEYLVVAGGGGGGSAFAGGGGGGGLLAGFSGVIAGTQLWVTVGAGGTAGSAGSNGGTGNASVFTAASSGASTGNIVATGGGGGGGGNLAGGSGGSGGGGGGSSTSTQGAGSGISGQGNAGALNFAQSGVGPAGGGGGAGTVGLQAVTSTGGNGGAGIASDISGTRTAYAGGGGGGSVSGTAGSGGAGGGGAGSVTSAAGTAGTANTGGGGGGGSGTSPQAGGNGGSGIVIISYPDTYRAAQATTGSPTITTSGSGSISFNGSTDYASVTTPTLGSGDFTIEFWLYLNSVTTTFYYDGRGAGSSGLQPTVYYSSGAGLKYFTNGADRINGAALSTSQWYHIAVSRVSGNTRMFINGTQTGSTYTDSNTYVASTTGSGWIAGSSAFWTNGYMTNLRIIVGTGLYSETFTVPTAPLTAVSGTQLLLSAVSGSVFSDSSASARTVSTFGAPAWNSSSPFATGGGFKRRVYIYNSSGSITF